MKVILCDMEGVFTPEIWINVAKKTGISELKLTTRDEPDYDKLMKRRIEILNENSLTLMDIQDVITSMDLLPGAKEFIDWLKERAPVIIVSDTFTQFATPLIAKLGYPNLFCNELVIKEGKIVDFKMRQDNGKQKVAEALKGLGYDVIALGDSYNDTNMLKVAGNGILFKPPHNVIEEFPQFPVTTNYNEVKDLIVKFL